VRASVAPPEPPPEPPSGAIAAAIQRFDDGSGTAWFRGTIPFAPGVVTSAADLDTVRVLVDGAEPASGVFIELVEGYHADDSYKAARVEFEATVNNASPVPCQVVFGQARTVPDRTTAQNTVEFTPRAWQLNPTLFGITDPVYLCDARLAPMPLVPDNDSRIAPGTLAYVTTGKFAEFLATTSTGASEYDEAYAVYCRYLTSGDLTYLVEGFRRNATLKAAGEKPRVRDFSTYLTAPDYPYDTITYPTAGATAPVNLNPVGYSATGNGIVNETHNYTLSHLMTYWLSGWEYGRLILEKNAAFWFSDWEWTTGTGAKTFGRIRESIRRYMLDGIAAALVRPTREIDMKGGIVFRSSTNNWTAEAAGKSMAERAQRLMARMQLHRDTVLETPAWYPKLLGTSTAAAMDTIVDEQGQPNFQLEFGWVFILAYINGIIDDVDMIDEAEKYAEWLLTQVSSAQRQMTPGGQMLRTMPYKQVDPAIADFSGVSGTYCMMVLPMFALHYALTGSTTSRDLFDELAANATDQFRIFDTDGSLAGTGGVEINTIKLFGQCMQVIRHAIAWRVNGFVGWEATTP
jgi:hypothetical protein